MESHAQVDMFYTDFYKFLQIGRSSWYYILLLDVSHNNFNHLMD